ncbi:YicC/YloC family endoribonuclease [Bdellovibrio svalbardensis]|uniref:YicC family protein n=1 Tax=Bdellovibrio svalbardensis TaxID=2972972 RepID=A0ABT6DKS3_9BACT|nr:YicC/YloC family endoribonuclease [Bdellovibrio svalbardensis]MDG0817455.1 YicC family protein [Bdellovibrio svalbardensis]
MKSMTGYGNARAQSKDVTVEVSIRSVNGRFLETRFHLPREFVAFESDLKKILGASLLRGTVDVFVSRRVKNAGGKSKMTVNDALAKKYLAAYKHLSKELGVPFNVHLEAMARLPEIIKIEDSYELFAGEEKILKKAFAEACKNCDKERIREGKALRKDLEGLLISLEKQVKAITSLREEANAQLQDKFEQKIRARLKGNEIDPTRLSQEIVIQLEKADINEELSRLSEHIKNYRQLVSSQSAEGKKLDFYTQELLREVNTIGSKSQVAKITQAVVEAKTLIERLREQVQNVQ